MKLILILLINIIVLENGSAYYGGHGEGEADSMAEGEGGGGSGGYYHRRMGNLGNVYQRMRQRAMERRQRVRSRFGGQGRQGFAQNFRDWRSHRGEELDDRGFRRYLRRRPFPNIYEGLHRNEDPMMGDIKNYNALMDDDSANYVIDGVVGGASGATRIVDDFVDDNYIPPPKHGLTNLITGLGDYAKDILGTKRIDDSYYPKGSPYRSDYRGKRPTTENSFMALSEAEHEGPLSFGRR